MSSIQILISYEMYMGTRVKFRLWSFNSQTSSPTHNLSIYIEIMIAHISINYWPPSTIRGCTWQLKKEIIYRDTSFRSEQVTYMVLIMPCRFHFILNLNQIYESCIHKKKIPNYYRSEKRNVWRFQRINQFYKVLQTELKYWVTRTPHKRGWTLLSEYKQFPFILPNNILIETLMCISYTSYNTDKQFNQ